MAAFSKTHTLILPIPRELAGEQKNRYLALRVSQLLKIQWSGLSGDTYLLYVRYARDPRRLGSRSGEKRVERVAITEDSRENVRWTAEEKRDVGMRNRGSKKKEIEEKEKKRESVHCITSFLSKPVLQGRWFWCRWR